MPIVQDEAKKDVKRVVLILFITPFKPQ